MSLPLFFSPFLYRYMQFIESIRSINVFVVFFFLFYSSPKESHVRFHISYSIEESKVVIRLDPILKANQCRPPLTQRRKELETGGHDGQNFSTLFVIHSKNIYLIQQQQQQQQQQRETVEGDHPSLLPGRLVIFSDSNALIQTNG